MKSIHRLIMPVVAVVISNLILSCALSPLNSDVSEAIRTHFESQGYMVSKNWSSPAPHLS